MNAVLKDNTIGGSQYLFLEQEIETIETSKQLTNMEQIAMLKRLQQGDAL